MKLPTSTNILLFLMHLAITFAIFYFNPVFAYLYVLGIVVISMHMDKREILKINKKIEQIKEKRNSLDGLPQVSAVDLKFELKLEEAEVEKLKEESLDLLKFLKIKVYCCWFILACFMVFLFLLQKEGLLF